jgi:diguanylate cyclase (GGDEF)-like protein
MYDPLIIDTFLRLHQQLSLSEVKTPEQRESVLAAITEAASTRFLANEEGSVVVGGTNMLALYELGRALSSNVMSIADVAELVGQHLQRVVNSRIYAFYLADHDVNEIRIVHKVGDDAGLLSGLTIPFGTKLSGWVAANRGTIVNSDPVLDLGEDARRLPQPLSSCLSTAVVADGSLIGVLSLYSDKKFTQDDARVVEVVSRHVASAFRSASEIERRRSSFTDAITGLPTAEYLKDIVTSEIAAALAGEQAMSIILVDVDHLKDINASKGRSQGDALLAFVATHIRRNLRTTDVLFRSVSDEFIVALPQTDSGSAITIAERIRALKTAQTLSGPGVCVGVATAPQDGYSLEELLRIARARIVYPGIRIEQAAGPDLT